VAVVLLALGAAAFFGISAVLMHAKASAVPHEQSLKPGLLVTLARQPVWLAGVGAQTVGFGMQATALEMGSLSVVQALGPVNLLVALPLAGRISGKRLRRADWAGAVATVGGLGAFLGIAAPGKGQTTPTALGWSVLLATTLVAAAVLVGVGRRWMGPQRAVALGTAAGTLLATTATLTKVGATRFRHGILTGLGSWEVYVFIVVGLTGTLLMQSSFQAGDIEWSLPAITVTNPVVSVLAGSTAFHERLSASGAALAALPVSLAVALWGIVVLARSPAIVAMHELGDVPARAEVAEGPGVDGLGEAPA
jgi:drug/metabolite transporter (DMT)-like permease